MNETTQDLIASASAANLPSVVIRPFTRFYPFLSGCTFPNRRGFQQITGKPRGTFWTRVVGGELLVDLDDFVGRCAYFVGDCDPKISMICDRLLRPGDIAIDIGANIGLLTLRMAARVGRAGAVHAFEPNPNLALRIQAAADRNDLPQIFVHNSALGNDTGVLPLYVPKGNMGSASIRADWNPGFREKHDVKLERLDDVLTNAAGVKLIKIDVEGVELNVLQGARQIIAKHRPAAVIFEYNDKDAASEVGEDMDQFFDALNYELFGIEKTLLKLKLIKRRAGDGTTNHDVCAIPRGDSFLEISKLLNAI